MTDKPVSPALERLSNNMRSFEEARRQTELIHAQRRALGICECGRGMKRAETEMCQHCEDDAQDGVVYLDNERAIRVVERLYAGEDR